MSRFQSSILRRWWDEEEESDDDDFFVVSVVLEGLKRKKHQKKFRGSMPGCHNVPRDILGGHDQIHLDYFLDRCVYNEKHFRRRFRMSKVIFLRIVAAIESHDRQKPDALGVLGASPIQKAVGARRLSHSESSWCLSYACISCICGFLGQLCQTGREHNHRILEAFCEGGC
jgi:hypothetical protein